MSSDDRLRLPSLRHVLTTARRPTEVLICFDRRRSNKVTRRDRTAWPRVIFYPVAGTGRILRIDITKTVERVHKHIREHYRPLNAFLTSFATCPLPLV
jgi:hypothetical protein